jgi:hypothetical protein
MPEKKYEILVNRQGIELNLYFGSGCFYNLRKGCQPLQKLFQLINLFIKIFNPLKHCNNVKFLQAK